MGIFEEIESLIDYIQREYSKITADWMEAAPKKFNLRRKCVKDIDLDGDIYKSINDYVKLLNSKTTDFSIDLYERYSGFTVTTRVKAQNSIEFKIQNYCASEAHEHGEVPIIKCINDLFGLRIILNSPLTFGEVNNFIKEKYGDRYKCIDSSKRSYKATHIYFKESNKTFPWELQIWNKSDCENNFASHKKYKQSYTNWEKESKEGGIVYD